ncbi:ATP-binding protein [Aquimarina muelleri]|uniref:ORC1/DEAH AAA+ ATPase domain-containing protein n=1 Tax=Aquimarina muelleri TaxID=279356 RepID=A0A918JQV2_9FLAO|nr:ATP-binding protein [Aquimarina muelleri]MCX2762335.1 ATP-binding protein [Aquimarina muelleri]GGX03511.1 hypothetical protein GCM10007384_01570 [Aquimarina muelleri]
MIETIVKVKTDVEQLAKQQLYPVLQKKIDKAIYFLESIFSLHNELIDNPAFTKENKEEILDLLIRYKEELSKLVTNYLEELSLENTTPVFPKYIEEFEIYKNEVENNITITQDRDRYFAITSDKRYVRVGKICKRTVFNISKIPQKIGNGFRSVFKKPKKPILYRNQNIDLQNITSYYYTSTLLLHLNPIINDINKEIITTLKKYWDFDKNVDTNIVTCLTKQETFTLPISNISTTLLEPLKSKKNEVMSQLSEALVSVFKQYEVAVSKAGTFELSNTNFKTSKIVKKESEALHNVLKNNLKWNTTFTILKDDWDIDIEVYTIVLKTHLAYSQLHKKVSNRGIKIAEELNTISEYELAAYQAIDTIQDQKKLKPVILKEIEGLKTHFKNKIIPQATQAITNLELTSVINEFENSQQYLLANVSNKRTISDNVDFLKPTSNSAISYISPFELINYESWPIFFKNINNTKVEMSSTLNMVLQTLNELGQIAEFNLESSLELLDSKDPENDSKTIALQGLQRSLDKIKEVKESTLSFDNQLNNLLFNSLDKFTKNLISFTENENIFDIKLIIAKAKSVEKSKALRKKIKNNIVYAIPIAVSFIKINFKKIKDLVIGILTRSGVLKTTGVNTGEVSDFLIETEKTVDLLPFVYQRLFRSETLYDENLFVGNTNKTDILFLSYTIWKKNRFAAVMIVGEKGSGKTSLLRHFLEKNNTISRTNIITLQDTIYDPEALFDVMNTFFSEKLNNLEDWVTFLNSKKKQVIVLEDIQHLYFRKINGFKALQVLSELIIRTHDSVFWICTCSKYTYQYLDKSIGLSEQFSQIIHIDDTTNDMMTEAIMKRHKVSGYNLYFEEPPKEFLNKKYDKATNSEKQNILQLEYYKDLNKIAKSNFKIAFMYWLRSVIKVSGSTIHMRSLKTIDLSFVEKLSTAKIFILNSILLHEKLKIEHIYQISSLDSVQTKRVVSSLLEHGFLVINKDYYSINTLLYRQAVIMLKNKNFIH